MTKSEGALPVYSVSHIVQTGPEVRQAIASYDPADDRQVRRDRDRSQQHLLDSSRRIRIDGQFVRTQFPIRQVQGESVTVGRDDSVNRFGRWRRANYRRVRYRNRRQAVRLFERDEPWPASLLTSFGISPEPIGAPPDGIVALSRFIVLDKHVLGLVGSEQEQMGRTSWLMAATRVWAATSINQPSRFGFMV